MNNLHNVQVDLDDKQLYLTVDGQTYEIPIAQASTRLANATHAERCLYRIAPSGYGIHWIAIDEDLSINGLLKLATVKS